MIDIEDWKAHCDYRGFRDGSLTIKRFWAAMETYS
jgi:hypothetical protein